MLQSLLFSHISREFPKDEESLNAKLLIRGGFIKKLSAGVYSYLPLGFRVLQKIVNIVREEMNALGAEEMLMPSLVSKNIWEKTGRWDVPVVYKLKDQAGSEFGLGWTHEEVIADIAKHFISSYEDLPRAVYQIQTKFRAETRAKSGVLRGREFLMKDLYSFHENEKDLVAYYEKVITAYEKILKRIELKSVLTEASGGAFTKEYTHEFQVLSQVGEDIIFYCEKGDFAQNKEVCALKAGDPCPKCGKPLRESNAIEVANVFKLGTKYSEAFGVNFKDEKGVTKPVVMGSYGIGPSRIMGTLVEVNNDENGIFWPEDVAPFRVHLIDLNEGEKDKSRALYQELQKNGVEVLYDDRGGISAGARFAESDLLGIPYRAVMSKKTGEKIEVKLRSEKEVKLYTTKEFIKLLS